MHRKDSAWTGLGPGWAFLGEATAQGLGGLSWSCAPCPPFSFRELQQLLILKYTMDSNTSSDQLPWGPLALVLGVVLRGGHGNCVVDHRHHLPGMFPAPGALNKSLRHCLLCQEGMKWHPSPGVWRSQSLCPHVQNTANVSQRLSASWESKLSSSSPQTSPGLQSFSN